MDEFSINVNGQDVRDLWAACSSRIDLINRLMPDFKGDLRATYAAELERLIRLQTLLGRMF